MSRRLWIFLFIFGLVNLIFVPLLSLYGLRVCPVLAIPGFGFGCYYAGIYIFITNFLNAAFILFLKNRSNNNTLWLIRYRVFTFAITYFVATVISLFVLQALLKINHLSQQSRAPEILAFSSLLLGIMQTYGLNWALHSVKSSSQPLILPSFKRLWVSHVLRTMLPLIVVASLLLHFLISQSIEFNDGNTAPLAPHDLMIAETSYVIIFLLAWLIITFIFHFLSERDHVTSVESHLDQLNKLDFKFRSSLSEAWGLWAAILNQLNSFSKTLGERTRLLKTFSKFVTANVAEQALHQELEATGIARDLTVIMSDIRNFTSMSESLTPKQVVILLNEYFTTMIDVIMAHQISVDKFIGDGILAYVDIDNEPAGDATIENRLAVEAALAMIRQLPPLNDKMRAKNLPEIKIGIGIFRGPLVIGLIGSDAKLQHTIIGDTVNKTSRLEGLCRQLGVSIVISEPVWHSLDSDKKAFFKSYGKQNLKGISEPLEVFGGPINLTSENGL